MNEAAWRRLPRLDLPPSATGIQLSPPRHGMRTPSTQVHESQAAIYRKLTAPCSENINRREARFARQTIPQVDRQTDVAGP
jgi:hypothetical protein